MAGIITNELSIVKSHTATLEQRKAAMDKIVMLTWKTVVSFTPGWLSPDEKEIVANLGLWDLYRQSQTLPDLENSKNVYKLLRFYTWHRGANVLKSRRRVKNLNTHFVPTATLACVQSKAGAWNDEDLAKRVFQRFLGFLNGLKWNEFLVELARRRFLLDEPSAKSQEEMMTEMGVPDALYRRLVTALNEAVETFCKDLLSGGSATEE